MDGIEAELRSRDTLEVPSSVLGDVVVERLRSVDQVAYIRFASVYRQFGDLEDLRREVEGLSGGRAAPVSDASGDSDGS